MDEKLKYRLVGASVILALAVFFLPMILDSEKYRSQIQSQIPEIPSEDQAQQSESLEQKNQTPSFQASGPVEKGPLVINLDDAKPAQQITQEKMSVSEPQESVEIQETEAQLSSSQQTEQDASKKEESAVASKPIEQQEPKQVTQTETPPKAEPSSEAKPQPKESTESELAFSDSAWLIQIGSFSNKENATKLVNSLREQDYRAYQRVGEAYARVYVGPYPVKGEAEQRTSDLEKIVGSKVKVIEFDPKQH